MSLANPPARTLTGEQILEMPDDGIDREIIRGELRERPTTRRNRDHSETEAKIAMILGVWHSRLPQPLGKIHSGEAGFRLSRVPETFIAADVAFASAELIAATDPKFPFYEGAPNLAVEVVSPSDQYGDVWEKVKLYLDAGSVVWVVDPTFRTVNVHRPGRVVETITETQELSGEPELAGFRVQARDLFI